MRGSFIREGNMGQNPELKYIDDKQNPGQKIAVASFSARFDRSVPTNDPANPYTDKGGFWQDVEIWGARGEIVSKQLKKGVRVLVIGDQIEQTWQDRESGEDRSKLVVKATAIYPALNSNIESISFKAKGQSNEPAHDQEFS